jgi:uncharacterized lipoprotein YddW (UPF0748 family)
MSFRLLIIAVLLSGTITSRVRPQSAKRGSENPPPVAREFRGVWVASVSNIDWPSRAGLTTEQQQAELLAILDRAVQLRLNAIILQVRPACDALYLSRYEPWSEYLTGQMGQAPQPFYDPLAFAVAEAHRRGLELHAWFNPYRARHPSGKSPVSPDHISRTHPEMVRQYGNFLWLDPGDEEVRRYTTRVVLDVVRRYDIDGVHIDDYFYPYRLRDSSGTDLPFPDDSTWARYQRRGGRLSRDDWRRDNVNQLIEGLYKAIKKEKPLVQFGISPFGIWRPKNPPAIAGLDAYQELYADSRLWLKKGWVDYFTPQLYWPVGAPQQSYPMLLEWWTAQNAKHRHIWPGNATYRIGSGERGFSLTELPEQIRLTRAQRGAGGNVHFSMRSLMRNQGGIADSLGSSLYAEPALVPRSPWLAHGSPGRPSVQMRADSAGATVLTLDPAGFEDPWLWIIRTRSGSAWSTEVVPGWTMEHRLAAGSGAPDAIVVSVVDHAGTEGPATTVRQGR